MGGPLNANLLKLYVDLNEKLCRTLTIKSNISAELINDYLIGLYGASIVDTNSPTTWKYYFNLSGSYHSTDKPMQVSSLDDLTTIDFTVSNLAIHKATRRAYTYGSRYYNSLLNLYPDQEQLILGILNPVNVNDAVDAKDGTILFYDATLIEPQEINVIPDLQLYIYNFIARWDVKAFGISDDLYPTAQLGILYLNVLLKLLNIRVCNSKTDQAHTFHIRQYLASHNGMDKYIPYMTLEQTLYLYRNIDYIDNNAGKSDQFHTLIEKLLSLRNIPINEYSIRLKATFDTDLYPDVTIQRKRLNKQFNPTEKSQFNYDVLIGKEIRLADGNKDRYDTHKTDIEVKLKTSKSSVIQTKDLESSMIDYSDSIPDPFVDVLFREWGHKSLEGEFNSTITITDPITLNKTNISVKDAFIYSYYLLLESIGITVVDLPVYLSSKHRVSTLPTKQELLSLTDNSLGWLADIVLDNQPIDNNIVSITAFNEYATIVFDNAYKYWFLVSGIDDLYLRAHAERMVDAMYGYKSISLDSETNNMSSWLANRGLSSNSLSKTESDNLISEIFKESTGFYIDKTLLVSNIQKYMIEALTELKSYTTQTVLEINDSRISLTNWSMLRIGDIQSKSIGLIHTDNNIDASILDVIVKKSNSVDTVVGVSFSSSSSVILPIDIKSEVVSNVISNLKVNVRNTIGISDITYLNQDHTLNDTVFIGYEDYLTLSATNQSLLKSIY